MILTIVSRHGSLAAGTSARNFCVLLPVFACLTGCQFNRPAPQRTYHAFEPEIRQSPTTAPASEQSSVRISRVRIAAPYGSRVFQYRTGTAEFTPTYYDLWADDPGALLAGELGRRLEQQNAWSVVFDDGSPAAGLETLDVRCSELYADLTDRGNPVAVITIRATLLDPGGVVQSTAEFTHREKASSTSPAAMVEGWSRGIEAIARDIGQTFR